MRHSFSFVLSLLAASQGVQASQELFFLADDTPLSSFLSPTSSFDEVIMDRPVAASPVFSSGDAHTHQASSEEERHFMDPWMAPSHTTPVPAWTPEMFFESVENQTFDAPAVSCLNQPAESAILWDKDNSPPLLRDDVSALPGVQEERSHIHRPSRTRQQKITSKRLAHEAIVKSARVLIRDLDAKESTDFKGKAAAYLTARIIEVSGQLNASDPEKYTLLSYGAELCLNAQNYVRARWCVDQILCAKRTYVRLAASERTQTVDAILLVHEQSKK